MEINIVVPTDLITALSTINAYDMKEAFCEFISYKDCKTVGDVYSHLITHCYYGDLAIGYIRRFKSFNKNKFKEYVMQECQDIYDDVC